MLWEQRREDNFKQGEFESYILKNKQDFGKQRMKHSWIKGTKWADKQSSIAWCI